MKETQTKNDKANQENKIQLNKSYLTDLKSKK